MMFLRQAQDKSGRTFIVSLSNHVGAHAEEVSRRIDGEEVHQLLGLYFIYHEHTFTKLTNESALLWTGFQITGFSYLTYCESTIFSNISNDIINRNLYPKISRISNIEIDNAARAHLLGKFREQQLHILEIATYHIQNIRVPTICVGLLHILQALLQTRIIYWINIRILYLNIQ